MKTVLVPGGGGYIGSVLVQLLLDAGHRVRVLDRFFFRTAVFADLRHRDGLTLIKEDSRYAGPAAFEGVDVVLDVAGISNDPSCDLDPGVTEQVNVFGASNLASRAKEAGVGRYVYSSSCSVYGEGSGDALTEDSAVAPVSLYAKSKLRVEGDLLRLQDQRFTVTILRNATVYGLSRRMRFDLVINLMTLTAYKNRRIHVMGGGKQWRPILHVGDAARAFLMVMESPREKVSGEIFNVGSNDQNYQVHQIAQMVRDVVPHTDVDVVPDDPDKRTYRVDFSKIAQRLGFKVATTPYEGIVEVKQALERGKIEDTVSTRTVQYYRYLLEAEELFREVSYNGRIF